MRNERYRKNAISVRERHNERKNEVYSNPDVLLEYSHNNVTFKACEAATYAQQFDRMVEEGVISTRGLKPDAYVFDELVFDVNGRWLLESTPIMDFRKSEENTMQVMIWTELKKLRRSRMLLVALFGLCMVLVIVTAQGFFAGGNEAYGMEPEWYLTGVQSLGTLYALPGIIALFGSYIICRESQEDVLKSLLLIPVNMGKMVVAKVMVILVFSVGTYLVLFLAAFAVEMAFHAQVLTAAIFLHYLKIYLVDGICVFFAVLPIICFITEKKLDYWLSLLAAEVYSFITIFVGNLGTISKLYPLVAAFTLSGYYESTPAEILLSVISMALCGTISGILIYRLSKRDALQ